MPKVSMAEVMACTWALSRDCPAASARWAGSEYQNFRKKNQKDRSKSPRPTTVKPMTAPALNATFRPEFRLSVAAQAVRQLAAVAIFMPMKPDRPEKKPPVIKAKGTNMVRNPPAAMAANSRNMATKNRNTPRYWRFRYAPAPLRTAMEIRTISREPGSLFRTPRARYAANSRAMTEPTGARYERFIDKPPFDVRKEKNASLPEYRTKIRLFQYTHHKYKKIFGVTQKI